MRKGRRAERGRREGKRYGGREEGKRTHEREREGGCRRELVRPSVYGTHHIIHRAAFFGSYAHISLTTTHPTYTPRSNV